MTKANNKGKKNMLIFYLITWDLITEALPTEE